MKYMCLIYVDEADTQKADPAALDEHLAFTREAVERGAYVSCDALEPPEAARTVRVRAGKVQTSDGPFAESKEVLGGFYVLECKDIAEAVEFAANIPPAKNGSIEVRPIRQIPGWGEQVEAMRRGAAAIRR